jgi:hypothetical protein
MPPPKGGSGLMGQQFLDQFPLSGLFVVVALITLACYEGGFRLGRWWQDRTPGEQEATGVLVGSILALMAFLLAVTMGMAADRFDTRRGMVLQEANAIETTFLRAGYLPAPADSELRELLREYLPLRIATNDRTQLQANIDRSVELHGEMWTIAEEVARRTDSQDLVALFLESLNETINLHESRVVAGIYSRVPETVVLLLLGGSALTLGMVGYGAGLTRQRGVISAVVLTFGLTAVLMLVVDLDRPRDGFLQVSQQPLIDVQQRIGPPSS